METVPWTHECEWFRSVDLADMGNLKLVCDSLPENSIGKSWFKIRNVNSEKNQEYNVAVNQEVYYSDI